MKKKDNLIKNIYLYIVTFVGIIISVIGSISLLDLGLKTYVFTKADIYVEYARPKMIVEDVESPIEDQMSKEENYKTELTSRRQRQASNSVAMVLVGLPLYTYHWTILKKSKK